MVSSSKLYVFSDGPHARVLVEWLEQNGYPEAQVGPTPVPDDGIFLLLLCRCEGCTPSMDLNVLMRVVRVPGLIFAVTGNAIHSLRLHETGNLLPASSTPEAMDALGPLANFLNLNFLSFT